MNKFEIRPQEIYLLERYSSAEYFKQLVGAFKNMLDAAERALDVFILDLPDNYRDRHISEQPDVVWGEMVLPNFRSTMDSLNYGYQRLLEGDLSALQYAGNVLTDFRAQSIDFWPDWMDEDNLALFDKWQAKASKLATNIKATILGSWPITFLTEKYNSDYLGELNLPESLPIYRQHPTISIKTDETVPQDGFYIPIIADACAQLMLKGHDASEALVGLDAEYGGIQYDHKEPTKWILVERIADEGGSLATMNVSALKGFVGQKCTQSGNWWSPANESQSGYFKQGDIFPEIKNNTRGETIWYLEVTNKE